MKKKKVYVVLIIVVLAMILAGCGNMSMGFGNYEFKKVHVDTYHYTGCFTVEKWYDNSTGIEVKTEEAGAMYLAEGTYILVEDKCPFCTDGGTEDE